MKDKIYKILPDVLQGLLISLFNILAYKERYGGKYQYYLNKFKANRTLSREDLEAIQKERFATFLSFSKNSSRFYKNYELVELADISQLPILKKEHLRQSIEEVVTISKKDAIVSKTGGTTGKSLEVLFTADSMQERFAMLDDFRGRFGYKLGRKTAWFSGKDLLTSTDISKNRFWKTDLLHKVRYYSTFHIKESYLKFYVEDLIKYQPEYMVGFPSTILEIAKYGINHGYTFPAKTVKAIFPTAESITEEMRLNIEGFFKTKMLNQYASSEGAPFIFECQEGSLHLELQSGVFEVLDDNNQPSNEGKLVVTSFTTEGTPLIRYDIGDSIILDNQDKICGCGNNNPMVKQILGRIDDYIYSPETGKINLGNVSNTLKDTKGILRFQAVQDELNAISILIVVDHSFTPKVEEVFMSNWRARVGSQMAIDLQIVQDIPVEKSGKYRIVKNNIKHLL
ncbi:phenylacetate--CoA ligase family protein [Soonwooa sp.]|uniref:phenylacetate--CoA ligase family protein n=1 Tax=Soonwooa sp. TaxID=1938592 RepID=UPI0028A93DD9|nr:phenylacetate--CoA ligase family protein [Soonwooa sp.]